MWAPVRKRFEHLVSAGAVGVTRLAAAFTPPGAEDREDLVARARGDGLVRDMADGVNRLAHLLQVGSAAIAGIEMALDERALVRWEDVLQVGVTSSTKSRQTISSWLQGSPHLRPGTVEQDALIRQDTAAAVTGALH